ncbi:hypothetical protein [Pseudoalteromonas sp. NBT06-2]|uniref:hypothetical protein n=1 Tax=Pseudoalteromonas sp. NBT06-2 TaxID=2025950 RepID=UPI001140BF57|nr:hypothetical protein [Pseudoalteromonas sp. NBT06-2]
MINLIADIFNSTILEVNEFKNYFSPAAFLVIIFTFLHVLALSVSSIRCAFKKERISRTVLIGIITSKDLISSLLFLLVYQHIDNNPQNKTFAQNIYLVAALLGIVSWYIATHIYEKMQYQYCRFFYVVIGLNLFLAVLNFLLWVKLVPLDLDKQAPALHNLYSTLNNYTIIAIATLMLWPPVLQLRIFNTLNPINLWDKTARLPLKIINFAKNYGRG